MNIPRPEYPRPQFVRNAWLNLNGPWQFEMDPGDSGLERGLLQRELTRSITVPFCPESELSGIGYTDFMSAVWYRRVVTIPAGWTGQRILLHLQACDYDTTVWADGQEVGRHRGGWTGFTCDLTPHARPGQPLTLVIRARDDHRELKPKGKQSHSYANVGCHYTRTTGIWQTVWLEPVPPTALQRPRLTPDVANHAFHLTQALDNPRPGLKLHAALYAPQTSLVLRENAGENGPAFTGVDGTQPIAVAQTPIADFAAQLTLTVPSAHVRLWAPGAPHLYPIEIQLRDAAGRTLDRAWTYAGLRSVTLDGKRVRLNGQPVFQRLVLDQGYYPDGILTAPTDAALVRDIELSLAAGFNGARLHQKVFEERFLHHADRLGYLVWGEFGDWGCNNSAGSDHNQQPAPTYLAQWLEALHRDYNHPAIIGWCPLNETHQRLHDRLTVLDDVTLGMFLATKAIDLTRPVLDTSGYAHRVSISDIYDSHDYEQDPRKFAENQAGLQNDKPFVNPHGGKEIWSVPYRGQPYFVSEFGGIWWNPNAKPGDHSWGYGDRPKSLEEFHARFAGLCAVLLRDPNMFGYCYTQLTDVFQEQNGIFTFDRQSKFDLPRLRAVQQQRAACEVAESIAAPLG